MRLLILMCSCMLTGYLHSQVTVYDVRFDDGIIDQPPTAYLDDPNNLTYVDASPNNCFLRTFTGVRGGTSEPAGLVAMVDHIFGGAIGPVQMGLLGEPFHGEVTEGTVKIELDMILEGSQNFGEPRIEFLSSGEIPMGELHLLADNGILVMQLSDFSGQSAGNQHFIPSDVWFHLLLEIDLDQNTTRLFIDDQDTGVTGTVAPDAGFLSTTLTWDETFYGMMCIDNIVVKVPDLAGATLPVAWRETTAHWAENCQEVQVKWIIAAEEDIREYQVERHLINGRWQIIGDRLPPGQSTYTFTDVAVSQASPLYRVRATEWNGVTIYSPVFGPEEAGCPKQKIISLFPNPAGATLWLSGTTEGEAAYVIRDSAGKEVQRGYLTGESTSLEVSGLIPGLYWLQTGKSSSRFVRR